MTTSGVYEYRNKITEQCYIGSSINTEVRKRQHIFALRRGKHPARYMQNSWNKYGKDAFEFRVLEEVSDVSRLIEREQYWIDTKHPRFNSRTKAESNLGLKQSPEVIQAKRERQTGVKRPGIGEKVRQKLKGRPASEETKALLLANSLSRSTEERRRTATGRKHSETSRRTMAEKATGRKMKPEDIEKMRLAKEGKAQSEEHIQARVAGMMGHEVSEAARRKSAESNRAVWAERTPEERHRIATNRPPISEVTRERQRESHLGQTQSTELVQKRIDASWRSKTDEEKAFITKKKRTTWANKSPEELALIAAKKAATRVAKRNLD